MERGLYMQTKTFNDKIKEKMDRYAHGAYRIAKMLPSEEKIGLSSQLRRASTSVILNFAEGYARRKPKVFLNFLETSFGSLKESQYILLFLRDERLIPDSAYQELFLQGEEIGAMLWVLMKRVGLSAPA
jgi:four helix bundle protein